MTSKITLTQYKANRLYNLCYEAMSDRAALLHLKLEASEQGYVIETLGDIDRLGQACFDLMGAKYRAYDIKELEAELGII